MSVLLYAKGGLCVQRQPLVQSRWFLFLGLYRIRIGKYTEGLADLHLNFCSHIRNFSGFVSKAALKYRLNTGSIKTPLNDPSKGSKSDSVLI